LKPRETKTKDMGYIKLNHSEQVYGKKNLLYAEMELLNSIKQYKKYKKLRKEELALKFLLKKEIDEVREELKKLDGVLPEAKQTEFKISASKKTPKRSDLEREIEEVRRKIEELQ